MSEGQLREQSARAGRTGVCRSCGALVGAGESNCLMCGAPSTASQASQRAARRASTADPETLRFVRSIVSRPATFTIIFITANVFLYLLMTLSGGAMGEVLEAYGAKVNGLINAGQWWRFVTPIFLHVNMPGLGPAHLLINMYSLFMLGPYVEKLYGSARFVVFWVLTGIAGVAASYLTVRPDMQVGSLGRFIFKSEDVPSAGASGALFGLVGVLFVFGIKYRHELPEGFKRAFGTGMLPMIFVNLFIGYVARGYIDNAAHLGGLVSGMALALCINYKRPGERGPVAFAWHAAQALVLLLVVFSFLMVARNYNGPLPSLKNAGERLRPGGAGNVDAYVEAMNEGQRVFPVVLNGERDDAAPALQKLNKVPALNKHADELREELHFLLSRAQGFASAQPSGAAMTREQERELNQLVADYKEWEGRFDQWVKTEGARYGLTLDAPSPQPSADDK
ncbi:MAG: rhomboid family intramembrane serine protease [Acidobacteria bacterium]|nr:rhomboid family intramembrane serine protease [Acidobacteriota bacterium]